MKMERIFDIGEFKVLTSGITGIFWDEHKKRNPILRF